MESILTIKRAYAKFIEYLNTLKIISQKNRYRYIRIAMEDTCSEKKTMQVRAVLDNVSTARLRLLEKRFTDKTVTKVKSSKPKKYISLSIIG